MSLPGGMWEPSDQALLETALRESEEEVGLNRNHVRVLGDLDFMYTRQGVTVKPYIAQALSQLVLEKSEQELHSLFWLPLEYLLQDRRHSTEIFVNSGKEYWAPVYLFKQYRVWGFTARVLVEFLKQYFSIEISKNHDSPVITINH